MWSKKQIIVILSFISAFQHLMEELYDESSLLYMLSEDLVFHDWLISLLWLMPNLWCASTAIRQAFLATSDTQRREKLPVLTCEHCPMVWYHKLCADAEGEGVKKTLTYNSS
jgi:hypothetical protein